MKTSTEENLEQLWNLALDAYYSLTDGIFDDELIEEVKELLTETAEENDFPRGLAENLLSLVLQVKELIESEPVFATQFGEVVGLHHSLEVLKTKVFKLRDAAKESDVSGEVSL